MFRHTRISDLSSNQDLEGPGITLLGDEHFFLFSFADFRAFPSLEPLFVTTSSSFPANVLVFKPPVSPGLFGIESIVYLVTHHMFRFSSFRGDAL